MNSAGPKHLVVIGGSAGAHVPLEHILRELPPSLSAAILVVLHLSSHQRSDLARILQRCASMPVLSAQDGELVVPGHVYVARPDHHLLIEPGWKLSVARGPKENRVRPSIDALFRSAAYCYGPAVVGVILSGMLDDGTAGLWAIKRLGGAAIAQAPADAQHASMPHSAITHVDVDHVLPAPGIAAALLHIMQQAASVEEGSTMSSVDDDRERIRIENLIAAGAYPLEVGVLKLGTPSRFSCPQCHGVLSETRGGPSKTYRCHTGHAYTARSLLEAAMHESGKALDDSFRALEEVGLMCDSMLEALIGTEQRSELTELKADAEAGVRAIRALLARSKVG